MLETKWPSKKQEPVTAVGRFYLFLFVTGTEVSPAANVEVKLKWIVHVFADFFVVFFSLLLNEKEKFVLF